MNIETVKKVQKASGLRDEAFARTLGYTRPYLSNVKNGNLPLTAKFLKLFEDKYKDVYPEFFLPVELPVDRNNGRKVKPSIFKRLLRIGNK